MLLFRPCLMIAACAAVAACGGERTPALADQGGEMIECALDGGERFEKVCMLQMIEGTDRFVLWRPDGGFRRLESDPNGGWRLVDGAEELNGSSGFDVDPAEFVVANDRFAIPLSSLPQRRND